jgi:hypothetical protein
MGILYWNCHKCGGVVMTLIGWLLSGVTIGLIIGWLIAEKIKAYIKKENEGNDLHG